MTAGIQSRAPRPAPPNASDTARKFYEHSQGTRVNTDCVLVEAIRAEYPELHLTVAPQTQCNLLAYAAAGHAGLAPIDTEGDRLKKTVFLPPTRRLDGGHGALRSQVLFGKFLLDWQNREFVVYVVNGRDGLEPYPEVVTQFILSPSVEATNRLLLEAGAWNSELHGEIWCFDGGFWQKDAELYKSIRKSSWKDVILDQAMKDALINEAGSFFDSRDTYERLKVPWKRGLIYYGPPGNGKTISIKALSNTLYSRKTPVPTLYVRTLSGFGEYAIRNIFALARREAPCLLVFEDLDSIVTNAVRSYFLNAVDGIANNDGIFMIGSTNHLDRLDPGIAKRPSRFDRKYLFPNPNVDERTTYMKYWQGKLADNDTVEFPDKLCPAVAKITDDFSFAYLQEVMVASLLAIARDSHAFVERVCLECMAVHEKPITGGSCDRESVRPFKGLYDWVWTVRRTEEDGDLDNYALWREIKKQVRIIREGMGEEKGMAHERRA